MSQPESQTAQGQGPDRPMTHEEIDSLHLFYFVRHFISERLLNRAMHALLNVASWEWMANVDMNNVNEGSDPTFDAIMHHMNSQTSFKYDVTWGTKPVFVWLMHYLHHIAKYGVSHFNNLHSNWKIPMNLEGLWKLETDPIRTYHTDISKP
jgi:hypothetical protein